MTFTYADHALYHERQEQIARRIRREEEFSDLRAAASYRRVGDKYMARVLIEHSRQWRLMNK
jgi:hypothetical protein